MREGWEIKKLGEAFQIKPPKSEAREALRPADAVSFVPMEDLGVLTKAINVVKERRLEDVAGSYTYFGENDVLLAKITPCFENGKLGIAKNLLNEVGFGSSEFIVFRSKHIVTSEYLFYFLSRDEFRQEGKKRMTGAVGHKRVSKDWIENYPLPFPRSKSEQHRIVSILDEAFAAIDQAKAKVQRNLSNAKELFQSELNAIFSQKGEGWVEKRVEDVCRVINGFAFSSKHFSSSNSIKSVKITNVGVKEFVEDSNNNLPEGFEKEYEEYRINMGDIVIALTRTIISSGLKVAVIPSTYNGALINQRVAGLVPNEEVIRPVILFSFLCSDIVSKYVIENVNTLMQPNLSISDLKRLQVPIPPQDEQDDIANKIGILSVQTKRLEVLYYQKLSKLEALKTSILQKAFSGELTKPLLVDEAAA